MAAATGTALAGKHVLVVEDEFLVAIDIEAELHENGARVTCAGTLAIAEACAKRERFDAAILDVNLHGKVSYPVADILRQEHVPFVFHTGQGEKRTLSERYPGVEVCNKPCDGTALVSVLGRVLADENAA
ncbi:response regulator [Aureimonas sp. SK2]|uniref:response regulator n=1 Tax=Aureimonas sp. SK2 TaxID=3015992 RepID=UPI0024437FFC|nr:response regulator [Aureimonas sp. SK2]